MVIFIQTQIYIIKIEISKVERFQKQALLDCRTVEFIVYGNLKFKSNSNRSVWKNQAGKLFVYFKDEELLFKIRYNTRVSVLIDSFE